MGERFTRFLGVFAGDPFPSFPFRLRGKNKRSSERAADETPLGKSKIPRFKTIFKKKP